MRRKHFAITRAVIRDFIQEYAEQKPTDELIDDFIDYLNIDVCEWLKDNWKCYKRSEPDTLHGKTTDEGGKS